jgi:hypothetical protein
MSNSQKASDHLCSICQSETQLAVYQCAGKCLYHEKCIAEYVSYCRDHNKQPLCPNCQQPASTFMHIVPAIIKVQQLQQEINELHRVNFGMKQELDYYRYYYYFSGQQANGVYTPVPVAQPNKHTMHNQGSQTAQERKSQNSIFSMFKRTRESDV